MLDVEVGKWFCKFVLNVCVKVFFNKVEGMYDDVSGLFMVVMGEVYSLGFGIFVVIFVEFGLGLVDLYEDLWLWVEIV